MTDNKKGTQLGASSHSNDSIASMNNITQIQETDNFQYILMLPALKSILAVNRYEEVPSGIERIVKAFILKYGNSSEYREEIPRLMFVNGECTLEYYENIFDRWESECQKDTLDMYSLEIEQFEKDNKSSQINTFVVIKTRYGHRLYWDSLSESPMMDGEALTDILQMRLFRECLPFINETPFHKFQQSIYLVCQDKMVNHLDDYMDSLEPIQGETNIQTVAKELGIEDFDGVHYQMLKMFLISLIARAKVPGCKVDTALILQGEQDRKKTSFFQSLVGKKLFQTAQSSNNPVDELRALHQSWLIEWGEVEYTTTKRGNAQMKAFMSQETDRFRVSYGRTIETRKRRFVMCGTTNRDDFLNDSTGSRRFWVVPVTKDIDHELIASIRDKVFGEALYLYESGEKWYGDKDFNKAVAENNDNFTEEDILESRVADFIETGEGTKGFDLELLCNRLMLDSTDNRLKRRLGDILTKLGAKKRQVKINGKNRKRWFKVS